MVKWNLVYTKQALKEAKKIINAGLRKKTETMLNILSKVPFQSPPHFEKLVGDLSGAYSRRINIKHKLVYQVIEEIRTIKVIRMWAHYE